MNEDKLLNSDRSTEGLKSVGIDTDSYRPKKGFFIFLLFLSAAFIFAALTLLWWVPTVGLKNIHPLLPVIAAVIFVGSIAFVFVGFILITITIIRGKDVLPSFRLRGLFIKLFFPLMTFIGGALRIPKARIHETFIDINNQLVMGQRHGFNPERILILMPHCIQDIDCKIKVTLDIENCLMCGKCEIKSLRELAKEFNIKMFVSSGGTMARRIVKEKRPEAIVAVACERDLASGIQDAYPLPVIGIINKRPKGYCVSTGVDVKRVGDAMRHLLSLSPKSRYSGGF